GKGRIYGYDCQNRMTGMTVSDGTNTNSWTYAYDDGGERIIKNTLASGNGGTLVSSTVYWFTGYEETYENVVTVDGDILAENGQRLAARTSYLSSADGTTIQKTEVLGRSKIDGEGGVVRPGVTAKTEYLYQIKDLLGSTVRVYNEDGECIETLGYEPFGKLIMKNGERIDKEPGTGDSGLTGAKRTYTGHMLETDDGLYYCHARWYDAGTGRFIQADSVLDGLNRYTYCGNNPVNFSDPTGTKKSAEQKAAEKAEKQAAKQAKKEAREAEKAAKAAEKQAKKEAREAEAKAIKEMEKLQKELKERDAKENSNSNPKAEYHRIDNSGSGPKNYDEANQTGGNTIQQPEPVQIAKNDPKPKQEPRQQTTYQPQSATESSSEAYPELPLQTAPNIGNSVASPNLVIRNRVSNSEIHITLMIPLYLNNIDEISTSKFDIEQRKKRKYKSFEFIQFYEGVLLGIESLKNEGCNVILNVVDIPGDLPDKVEQSFSTYNIAQSDLIIALLEKNAFEKAAQLAQQNNVFILNPFSSRPEILDQNPYVVKLAPSYQGIISSVLSMVTKSYSSPNLFIVHSNGKLEKRFLDEFQQQLKNQNKIKYTIFDWSANAKLVGMLKASADDNIVINLYDQNKDKNKTQSSLILNRLFSIKKNTPTLITMPNWASKYEDIDYNQLQRLNYHFLSNSYLDYNNPKHKAFIER
ncbi:MAG: hypothetical protein J6T33_04250, partial [Bacteroidales bacterium]|nr:hypothetical protein [Bacteroidales bacterium]